MHEVIVCSQAKEQRGQIACQALDFVLGAMGGVNLVSRPAYGAWINFTGRIIAINKHYLV
jgi:hypothetical protein